MSILAKTCIKLGRQSAYSTSDFVEAFGADLKIDGKVDHGNKDWLVMAMANVIMELTSKGKFDLKNH